MLGASYMKHRALTILLAVSVLTPAALADATATLTPLDTTAGPADLAAHERFPLLTAELAVANDTDAAVGAVALKPAGGGPTILYDWTIPPGSSARLPVHLPAVEAVQVYAVRLLPRADVDAPPVAVIDARISWPIDSPAFEAGRSRLLDWDAYEPWDYSLPQWPEGFRRNIMLAMALGAIGLGGVLLLRWPWIRIGGFVLVVAVTAGAIWVVLDSQPVRADLARDHPDVARKAYPGRGAPIVLATRRTQDYRVEGGVFPIWRNLYYFRQDRSVIRPGQGISLSLEPRRIRVFEQN